jgi:hypothetical protein
MKKQQQKKNTGVKEKTRKLPLNKQTIKDLDPKTDNPKGGAAILPTTKCAETWHCDTSWC